MGSTGGTKLANSLFGQITKASNALGAQAGESMNPGVKIAANLTSASASNLAKGFDRQELAMATVEAKGVAAIKSAIDSLSNKTITITEIIKTVWGQIAAKGHAAWGLIYGSGYGGHGARVAFPGLRWLYWRTWFPISPRCWEPTGCPGSAAVTGLRGRRQGLGLVGFSGRMARRAEFLYGSGC